MAENKLTVLRDLVRARRAGPAASRQRGQDRLAELVSYARVHSPYYRRLYRGPPDRITDPALLPVTDKKQLMTHFDDWSTDREVTLADARAFVGDPGLVGRRFLGRYTVTGTSGTTGTPGVFLVDDHAMTVNVMLTLRMMTRWLGFTGLTRAVLRGGRMAMVVATGGHFLVSVGVERVKGNPLGRHVSIVPLVFNTLVDGTPGIELFQVEQTSPATLVVRLRPLANISVDPLWTDLLSRFDTLLSEHGLPDVRGVRSPEPPQQAAGGKIRPIIPLTAADLAPARDGE